MASFGLFYALNKPRYCHQVIPCFFYLRELVLALIYSRIVNRLHFLGRPQAHLYSPA